MPIACVCVHASYFSNLTN